MTTFTTRDALALIVAIAAALIAGAIATAILLPRAPAASVSLTNAAIAQYDSAVTDCRDLMVATGADADLCR